MSAFDEFFAAAREAFGRNRDVDWPTVGLVLGAAILVAVVLAAGVRRWRTRRRVASEVAALAAAGDLDGDDLDLLRQSARAAGLPLLEVMTSLAPFEHATAEALSAETAVPRPTAGSEFERVRRLRKALGFATLSPHLWLLTTRELAVGDSLALGEAVGQVVEANEAAFAVDLPAGGLPTVGTVATLTIHRPADARYLARVRVLAVEALARPGEGAAPPHSDLRRVFFAHDEQPRRQQQREHVRVPVHGTVAVTIADPGPGGRAAPRSMRVTGTLVDVSVGGLALDLPASADNPVRRGARIRCSFIVGEGQSFQDLGALVVAAIPGTIAGTQHLRASFTGLNQKQQDALAAAVAAQQRSLAHVSHASGGV